MSDDEHQDEHSDRQTSEREVVDNRQRGWFWHWNGIVTQYAPLIGLKGVGLLNSYTVWTDRREESPHRGYAFPSQQSEADFYGEERAELITINKILVALGLIEIRKEMILRTDERGRRWRVPHNLYRVTDRPEGVALRACDVKRVAIVAAEDDAVFRYVRRVFSTRFKPIDRDNVWHTILVQLAEDPLWQELQERTREIEERASARTRAGHRRRAVHNTDVGGRGESGGDPESQDVLSSNQRYGDIGAAASSSVAGSNDGRTARPTIVASINNGSTLSVDTGNSGSDAPKLTSGAPFNSGHEPTVAPSNTTYHQESSTTKTTTSSDQSTETGREGTGARRATPLSETSGDVGIAPPVLAETEIAGSTNDAAIDAETARVLIDSAGMATDRSSGHRDDPVGDERDGASDRREGQLQSVGAGEHGTGLGNEIGRGAALESESGWDEADDEPVTLLAGTSENRRDQAIAPVAQTGRARAEFDSGDQRQATRGGNAQWRVGRASTATDRRGPGGAGAAGPVVDPSPLVVSIFEAANNRGATPLERILLGELERDAGPAARASGSTGADWLTAAMREAVASGSAFVAPKRIREIINRWASDGSGPGAARSGPSTGSAPSPAPSVTTPVVSERASDADPSAVRLPGGVRGATVWAAVLDDLSHILDRGAFERLLAGSVITRYWRGTVEIRVGSESAVGKLSGEYRGLVERHLNARLKRPVGVSFHVAPDEEPAALDSVSNSPERTDSASPASDDDHILVSAADVELGRQLWHVVLDDLGGDASADDLERLAPVVPLGQDSTGTMILGVSSPVARRLIEAHYRSRIERSLSGLLGRPITLRTLGDDGWSVRG